MTIAISVSEPASTSRMPRSDLRAAASIARCGESAANDEPSRLGERRSRERRGRTVAATWTPVGRPGECRERAARADARR